VIADQCNPLWHIAQAGFFIWLRNMEPEYGFDTLAIRAGTLRSEFGEHSEALFLTSSFVFDSAAQAAQRFAAGGDGFVYSRFSNPTVAMFQSRLAALEGGEACLGTASGMSAILVCCLASLKSGDHIVSSRSIFGATVQLFNTVLARFGVGVTYVDGIDLTQWRSAMRPNTRLVFAETPSNPMTEVVDIAAIAALAHESDALFVVDNCFCTPALQRPLQFGADVVIHSATKHLDGQGRVLGGAIVASRKYIDEQVAPVLRTTGASMSPFNAWVFLKGLETLSVRMQAHCVRALAMAQWLESHPAVARVHYPWLASHAQHALARTQQTGGGAILSFELKDASPEGQRERAWRVVDGCKVISITGNLGDTRSTITHPATTTHARVAPEVRAATGVGEGLLRLAVGLEDLDDLKADLAHGLG
jgi:O-succinylhomoserine sulfhydrylase